MSFTNPEDGNDVTLQNHLDFDTYYGPQSSLKRRFHCSEERNVGFLGVHGFTEVMKEMLGFWECMVSLK